MKSSRNESCPCGSGKKYKNCCHKKGVKIDSSDRYIHWFISGVIGFLLAILVWGVLEHFTTDRPEMEAYKCDNPNCGQIHYRPKSNTN